MALEDIKKYTVFVILRDKLTGEIRCTPEHEYSHEDDLSLEEGSGFREHLRFSRLEGNEETLHVITLQPDRNYTDRVLATLMSTWAFDEDFSMVQSFCDLLARAFEAGTQVKKIRRKKPRR